MNDAATRVVAVVLSALAALVVVTDAPANIRVPVVVVFALLGPGLAATRFLPTLDAVDRLAVASALSLALTVLVSLALVAAERWKGDAVLAAIVAVTLAAAAVPRTPPWRDKHAADERRRNEQIRARRRAQNQAYDLVMSADADERRRGLTALSWLLDDDGRRDEAKRLRAMSRLPEPPVLTVRDPGVSAPETVVRDAHARARSADPETRREGLLQVAAMLDETGRRDEADSLRAIASGDTG